MLFPLLKLLLKLLFDKDPKQRTESLALQVLELVILGVGVKTLWRHNKTYRKGIEHFKPNITWIASLNLLGGDVKAFEKFGTDKKDFVDALLDKGLSSKSKTDDVLGALKKLSAGEDLVQFLKTRSDWC